ncbi:MAG: 4Fe-4S dicluster domain-containing protein [Desulfobacterium sp.]|nr:4Fe-4S dicluster domain-containing protein [Desulfobacterium sp.]
MKGKSFFVDLTLCTACRGCQVACKQWKKLPAEKTRNVGSHQNPQDLSSKTIRLVRFNEVRDDKGKLNWFFFPEQCRHCIEPPCKHIANMYNSDAVIQDKETGAVMMTDRAILPEGRLESWQLCPYNVPRKDEETGLWSKCDMCNDRVKVGMLPACVTSCPTGTMNFGNRDEMLELAHRRLAEVQKTKPHAYLADPESVRVIYLCEASPENYHDSLIASTETTRKMVAKAVHSTKKTRREFITGRFGQTDNRA